jgi:hypothetical protein
VLAAQGGRVGAAALALLCLWQPEAAELFERQWQGGVDGNVRASAAAHPWMLAAAAAVAAAAGGRQWRLLCSACVGAGR